MYSLSGKRVWVAGHKGMVGAGLVRQLEKENCTILTVDRDKVDLRDAGDAVARVTGEQCASVWMRATVSGKWNGIRTVR